MLCVCLHEVTMFPHSLMQKETHFTHVILCFPILSYPMIYVLHFFFLLSLLLYILPSST